MALDPPVVVENIYKKLDNVEAVRGVSFKINKGEIFGLIGPNGAGKTTTLRIVVGLLRPDKGKVRVFGLDPIREGTKVRKFIGYLPEDAGVYRHLSGLDFLKFIAEVYAESDHEAEAMIERAVKIAGLGDRIRDKASSYSKGMKRRLLLAATLMTNPKLAVLDEPTSGLDVYYSVAMRKIIRNYVDSTGASVLLSSHNMLEVEYLCDRVAFINRGQIIAVGSPKDLTSKYEAENLEEAFIRAVEEAGESVQVPAGFEERA